MTLILSGTDGLSDIDGSAATPAIRGTDTNTGIFFPAADTIAFSEGGTEAMRIDSAGNVGIGTSSLSALLTINSETNTTAYNGSATDGQLTAGATQLIRAAAGANTNVAQLVFQSRALQPFNRIVSSGGTAPFMAFATNNAERARIDSSGNVGIGTSSPATKLDVNGPASVTSFTGSTKLGVTVRGSTAATDYSGIDFIGNSQTVPVARIAVLTTGNGSSLSLGTSNNYGTGITNTAMTIDSSGNLLTGSATASGSGLLSIAVGNTTGGAVAAVDTNGARLEMQAAGASTYLFSTTNDPLLFGTNNTERARITNDGNFCFGTTSTTVNPGVSVLPTGRINIGRSNDDAVAEFYRSGTRVGQINVTTTATSYITSSDYRLKENIAPMTGALATVAALNPCTYTWKADGSAGQGFIAHELAEVCPQAVVGEKDAVDAEGNPVYQGIDTSFLVATLTAAIQELKAELDATKAEVAALKGA